MRTRSIVFWTGCFYTRRHYYKELICLLISIDCSSSLPIQTILSSTQED